MPFCPRCNVEYIKEASACEDCGVPLVDFLPVEEEEGELPASPLVEVWCAPNETEAQMVRALLEANRIRSMLSGESLRLTHGIMVDGLAEVRIFVRSDEGARASGIVAEYLRRRDASWA